MEEKNPELYKFTVDEKIIIEENSEINCFGGWSIFSYLQQFTDDQYIYCHYLLNSMPIKLDHMYKSYFEEYYDLTNQ